MNKELIIFDFFGVISTEVYPVWAKRYFSEDEKLAVRNEIINKGDKGELSEKEVFFRLSKIVNEESNKILNDWLEIAVINQELVDFIIELKKKYKVILLSNATGEFLHRILERIDVKAMFDMMIISSEVKMVKPDKEIFEYALRQMNIDAEKAIFIDDNIKNIKGAALAGIDGFVYKDLNALKLEFK